MSHAKYWRWMILWMLLFSAIACSMADDLEGSRASAEKGRVTVEYIAHACFRVTSSAGKQLLIDPYGSRVWIGYDFPQGIRADAVLISHPHYDHDGGESVRLKVPWSPETTVLRKSGTNQ